MEDECFYTENILEFIYLYPKLISMIVTGNPLFTGVSGKLKNLVVKQYQDKTVITAIPDMSGRKLSTKQKAANSRMQFAILSAKKITADPRRKQRACQMAITTFKSRIQAENNCSALILCRIAVCGWLTVSSWLIRASADRPT